MKTNSSARPTKKSGFAMICLAIAVLALVDLGLCGSIATRMDRATAMGSEVSQAPSMSMSDLMRAFR
jgi:hypothetical protein